MRNQVRSLGKQGKLKRLMPRSKKNIQQMKRASKKSKGGKTEMSSGRHVFYKHYSRGIKRGFFNSRERKREITH